jgi:hypothetical protein
MQTDRRAFMGLVVSSAVAALAMPDTALAAPSKRYWTRQAPPQFDPSKIEFYGEEFGTVWYPEYGTNGYISTNAWMFPMLPMGPAAKIVYSHRVGLFGQNAWHHTTLVDRIDRAKSEAKAAFVAALSVNTGTILEFEEGCHFPAAGTLAVIRKRKDQNRG